MTMTSNNEKTNYNKNLNQMLNEHFAGKVVRKDLTKLIKEGANVPIYVLEYLLGMYCASDDEEVINQGLEKVKQVLAENYVRPDEAEKIKSKIKECGNYKIIDKVEVKLNEKKDCYEATLANTGIKGVYVPDNFVRKYEKLLVGGIWSIINIQYMFDDDNKKGSPFSENVGILLKEVSESYCNNSQLRSFWIPFAEKYKSSPSGELVCLDLHKSLPKGFLESCIDVLEDNTLIQNQLVLDERGPWNEVAKILFSWTFSYKVNTR